MKIQSYIKDQQFLSFIKNKLVKKKLIICGYIIFGILVAYNFLLKPTGVFVMYNNPTTSNEPNIKLNSKTLVTNLIDFEKGDFVCYKFNDEILGNHIRVHRLVAKENDTIQIRKGVVYVNNVEFDEFLNLNYSFKVNQKKALKIDSIYRLNGKVVDGVFFKGKHQLYLSRKFVEEHQLNIKRTIDTINQLDLDVKRIFINDWNKDNFGPLVIPKNKIFVLGDNRDNTLDSRTVGFIAVDAIVGVVFKIY